MKFKLIFMNKKYYSNPAHSDSWKRLNLITKQSTLQYIETVTYRHLTREQPESMEERHNNNNNNNNSTRMTAEQESNCSSTDRRQSDGDCNVVLEVIEKLPLTSLSSSSIALPEKPMEQDNDLQRQLDLANWKADESMRALLQLAEGVRLVTRQMKTYSLAATDGSDQDNCSMGTDGSCNSSSAFKTIGRNRAYSTGTVGSCNSSEEDRKIHDLSVRLEGPIGADLLGLSSAAHMVHEHAKWADHEASLLTQDAAVATKAADEALARTERAERAVQRLYQETKSLRTQLQQHRIERKVLAREVRSLRKENKSLRGYLQDTKRIELMLALEQHVHRAMDAHEVHMKQQTTKLRAKTLSEDYVVTDEFDESIMMTDPTNNNQSLSTTEQNETKTTTAAPVKEEEEEEKKKEPTQTNEQQVENLDKNKGPQHPQDVNKTEPVSVDANRDASASDEDDKKKEEDKDRAATTVDTKTKPKGKARKPPHRPTGGAFGAFGGMAALTVKPAWVLKPSYPAYRVPKVAPKTNKKTSAAAAAASTDAKKSDAPASANAGKTNETLSSETDSRVNLAPSSRKENVRNNVNKDNPEKEKEPGAPERTSSTTTKAHENKENRYQPLQLASKAKAPPLTSKFAGYFQRPLVPRKPSTKNFSTTTTTTNTSTAATTTTSSTKESTVVSSSDDSLPKEDCPQSATNNDDDNNNKTKPTRLEIPRHVTLGRQSLLSPFGSDDSPVAAAASGRRQSDIDRLCDARVLRSLALPEELSSTTPGGGSAPYCCPSEIARIYEQIENLYEC